MTEYFYMNGQFVEKENATLPVMTHAFLYGSSIFEGIRAYYNAEENQLYAFRVREHYERLYKSAKIVRMTPTNTVDEYCKITIEQLKKNNYRSTTYIRPTLYKAALKIGTSFINNPDAFLLITLPMEDYIDTKKGLKVCVSNWRRNSDNALPPRAKISGAYVNTALMSTDARLAGFDDAISLDDSGHVTEGSAMNLFLVFDGKLVTTPCSDNILRGITRDTVFELAKDLNLETEVRTIDRTELYLADEAFFCGTGAQISPITSIDNRTLGTGEVSKIVTDLQKLYFDVVQGKVPKYKKWCTPVYD